MFMHRRENKMDNEKNNTTLTDLADGQTGTIISIIGGKHAVKRLADLGLKTGTRIKVVRKTLFSGPVQIEVSGSRLILGRGLASKIIVEST
jgi:ferrous iron transport protein A